MAILHQTVSGAVNELENHNSPEYLTTDLRSIDGLSAAPPDDNKSFSVVAKTGDVKYYDKNKYEYDESIYGNESPINYISRRGPVTDL